MDLSEQIAKEIRKKIDTFEPEVQARRVGHVLSVADGVAKVSGLPHASYLELLSFPHNIKGVVINLEEDAIGAIILGDYLELSEGDEVQALGDLLSVPVGKGFLGRVINPLGEPIGGGQRQLIIGDRNTGKTAVTIDTIINQRPARNASHSDAGGKENVLCIYVAIGQKTSRIAHVIADLTRHKA